MKLLALDTATERCSAALWLDGELHTRAVIQPRGHGELIVPMIDQLLAEGALGLTGLDAIAFGRGPGAFTGVRLAASIAQGLAYGANLPVLPVSDLAAVAQQAFDEQQGAMQVLVCQDARMAQVYWGWFECCDGMAASHGPEQVGAPASVIVPAVLPGECIGAGSGFAAYPSLALQLGAQLSAIRPALLPDAGAIARLAAHAGVTQALPAEAAQPVYLRDQVAIARPQN